MAKTIANQPAQYQWYSPHIRHVSASLICTGTPCPPSMDRSHSSICAARATRRVISSGFSVFPGVGTHVDLHWLAVACNVLRKAWLLLCWAPTLSVLENRVFMQQCIPCYCAFQINRGEWSPRPMWIGVPLASSCLVIKVKHPIFSCAMRDLRLRSTYYVRNMLGEVGRFVPVERITNINCLLVSLPWYRCMPACISKLCVLSMRVMWAWLGISCNWYSVSR